MKSTRFSQKKKVGYFPNRVVFSNFQVILIYSSKRLTLMQIECMNSHTPWRGPGLCYYIIYCVYSGQRGLFFTSNQPQVTFFSRHSIYYVSSCNIRSTFMTETDRVLVFRFFACLVHYVIVNLHLFKTPVCPREECRLTIFENWILRRIFGPKRDGNKLHSLHRSPNIVRVVD